MVGCPVTARVLPGLVAGVALTLLVGCPSLGIVDDGTSVSYGPSNLGKLLNPARLPAQGQGYVIPRKWRVRGLNYGTDEMVEFIVYTGRQLGEQMPDATLQVADLSPRRGGPSAWHRSHQTGRDVDFLFFVRDVRGKRVLLADMLHFPASGRVIPPGAASAATSAVDGSLDEVVFDVASNWVLVRTLIENPVAEVQYIFIDDELKQKLLDHARQIGEPADVVAQASHLLHQPGDSAPHDDHVHVRIFCAPSDVALGCRERGVLRWAKKDLKYGTSSGVRRATVAAVRRALHAPMAAMMALGWAPRLP